MARIRGFFLSFEKRGRGYTHLFSQILILERHLLLKIMANIELQAMANSKRISSFQTSLRWTKPRTPDPKYIFAYFSVTNKEQGRFEVIYH